MLRCLSSSLVQFCSIDSLILFEELSQGKSVLGILHQPATVELWIWGWEMILSFRRWHSANPEVHVDLDIYISRERERTVFFLFLWKFDFMEVRSCWCRSLNYTFDCDGLSILEFREVFSCRHCLDFVSDNGSWLHPCIDTDIPWLMENSRHEKLMPGVLPKTI
jgi:hypothetical protein